MERENTLAEEKEGRDPVIQCDIDLMVTHNYIGNGRARTAHLSGSVTQVGLLPQDFSLFLLHQHINALHHHSLEV